MKNQSSFDGFWQKVAFPLATLCLSFGSSAESAPVGGFQGIARDSLQEVADGLYSRDLRALARASRTLYRDLMGDAKNKRRTNPWHILVSFKSELNGKTTIKHVPLFAGEMDGWDKAQDILEWGPHALAKRPFNGRSLLDHLPLKSWDEQMMTANAQGVEPDYLKTLSRVLGAVVAEAFADLSPAVTSEDHERRALQILMTIEEFLMITDYSIDDIAHSLRKYRGSDGSPYAHSADEYACDAFDRSAWQRAADSYSAARYVIRRRVEHKLEWTRFQVGMDEAFGAFAAGHKFEECADQMLTNFMVQAAGDQSSPDLGILSRGVYRAVERASLIYLIKHVPEWLGPTFAATFPLTQYDQILDIFSSSEAWGTFRAEYFGALQQGGEGFHFLHPWLSLIDYEVQQAALLRSSSRDLKRGRDVQDEQLTKDTKRQK